MTDYNESRLRTIVDTAFKCVKMAFSLSFAGLMGLIVVLALIHVYDTHPRLYATSVGIMAIGTFIYMTIRLAKQGDDNGKEGMA